MLESMGNLAVKWALYKNPSIWCEVPNQTEELLPALLE